MGARAHVVKIGHDRLKAKPETLCHSVEEARRTMEQLSTEFVIVESNRAHDLRQPELAIFIEGAKLRQKPSAARAKRRADIVIAQNLDLDAVRDVLVDKNLLGPEDTNRLHTILAEYYHDYSKKKSVFCFALRHVIRKN